jgi:serine/threonine protein phosphatase PrpC
MGGVNGDAFVLKQWSEGALVGVIDGLGHGQFAYRAAQTARQYVESHFDQPLEAIFRGVERTCSATRGVVMALARFAYAPSVCRVTFASIGNIEVRLFGGSQPGSFLIRRGVLGLHAPAPVVTEHPWEARSMLVLHSDGVTTRWRWEDFRHLAEAPATAIAQQLLRALAKANDDATVVVVKNAAGRATPL